MERFAKKAVELLQPVLQKYSTSVNVSDLDVPSDPKYGDFAYACFGLAKLQKKAPPVLAKELFEAIPQNQKDSSDFEISHVGPYLNFLVKPAIASTEILKSILKDTGNGQYARQPEKSRSRWVLEYSSPNVAKPFMIGHLRGTALGAALDRIARYRGFDVISINHLGDWGTQYGKLAIALKKFQKELPSTPTLEDLVRIYVKFHDLAEQDPSLEDEAREAFARLEKGDPELTALWKRSVAISIQEFQKTYQRLGVNFDHIWGESHYKDLLTPLLEDLKKKGLLVQSEGAWVVPLTDDSGKEIPPCILIKADGATLYATRDIAAALYRYDKFHFDRMSYVVGAEQKLHFVQIFGVLKKMGCEWVSKCEHIPNGLFRFKGAKMSTRKGNFVTLQEVLETTRNKVSELLKERAQSETREEAKPLSATEQEEIVETVALGSILFFTLSTDPVREVEFDVDRVTDFNGETGPYLQYAHTRCLSILEKAKKSGELKEAAPSFQPKLVEHLKDPAEIRLVKILGQFSSQLERTLHFAKPSQLTTYLIEVTRAFGDFYHACHVLGQEGSLTSARLMLVESARRVLSIGLDLLGIPKPKRM